jgi:hypothetical protein
MGFGSWNLRSLRRSGSLATAARELARYVLYLVGVQVVRLHKGRTERAGDYFFLGKRKRKSSVGNRIFVHHRTVSSVKRVEFVSDRMSYIDLKGRLCNNIALNVHAPMEEKSGYSKDSS